MVNQNDINMRIRLLRAKAALRLSIPPEKCHIGHLLLQAMLERPNDLNQIDGATDARETNLSVAVRASRLASAMGNAHMQPGDPVIITGHNHLDIAVPFFASHFNGYPVCGIDPNVAADDLQIYCHAPVDRMAEAIAAINKDLTRINEWSGTHGLTVNSSKTQVIVVGSSRMVSQLNINQLPQMVFCEKTNEKKVRDALGAIKSDAQVVIFDDNSRDLETFIQKNNGTDVNYRPAEFNHSETTAWLILTSGTTGQPKVAIIPFDTLLNGVCTWWTPITYKFEITLTMANLQWMSTLIFYVTGPLLGFVRLQSSAQMTPQHLIGLINKHKPNLTAWTPYLLGQFLVAAENVCDLSSFKYIAIGGSAIEKPLVDRLRKKCDAVLYLIYGMTKLLVPVFDFDENTPFGSTGKPSEKYQFKLLDNDKQVIDETYMTGELWIKGDAFFKGYLNNPEETKTILTDDGWFKTGDMFYRDEQDYYYFVERKRLLIKHFGFLIAPLQMEEVIKRHPGVIEACVVGVPDPDCMELPIAAIMRKNDHDVEPQDIFNLLREALPELKQLRGGLFFVDALPLTPSGKVHRAKVRDMALVTPRIMPQ